MLTDLGEISHKKEPLFTMVSCALSIIILNLFLADQEDFQYSQWTEAWMEEQWGNLRAGKNVGQMWLSPGIWLQVLTARLQTCI